MERRNNWVNGCVGKRFWSVGGRTAVLRCEGEETVGVLARLRLKERKKVMIGLYVCVWVRGLR